MSTIPKTPVILDKIVDIVLSHKPKKLSKTAEKRTPPSKSQPKKNDKNAQ